MGCFGSFCFGNNEHLNMNGMPELGNSTSYDWTQHVQLCGILMKKPFGHNSNKWYRRFFVVRDGFLLYYPENEKKEMDKRKCLNIHPKGIVPLGECLISRSREPNQPYAFQIESADINGRMLLAADSDYERDKWIDILEKSKRITWKHALLADDMIKHLEDRGLKMAQQKQEYFDQLQLEVKELSDEREKKEELEKLNEELTKEKEKMEHYTLELNEEYEKTKTELDEMAMTMRNLECDRESLSTTLSQQHDSLQLSQENLTLHQTKEELEVMLKNIEEKTQELLVEKAMAEERLKENEEKARMLEEEKQHFDEHAKELQDTIEDLKAQKEMTEAELKVILIHNVI
ncbi:hypothetical protein KUTeg_014045 [Tegillarca granosa]|uniref:PH domain-containing protein n=1 Tax=Tegillarca granosa TaxID=220873 RepID=A0ABQ9EVF2_TEGGR|nr:hypothetical protein KUTeg_014045 [Tegillarca granosa]